MEKTKIVVINPWYTPYRLPVLKELCKFFAVTVIYLMRKESGREWEVPENLPFKAEFLPSREILRVKRPGMYGQTFSLRVPWKLWKHLKSISPRVIVGLEFRLDCMVAALYSRIHGIGYVTWSDMTHEHDKRMGAARLFLRKMMLAGSGAVVASCTDTISYFRDVLGVPSGKLHLSILGSNVPGLISSSGAMRQLVARSRQQRETVRFVYVGSLIPRKGVDLLVRAYSELVREGLDVRLSLVGSGPERSNLQELCSLKGCAGYVDFLGSRTPNEVPSELVKHDVFVFPTRLDVFGLAVAEAVLCGLPIVCSRYAGAANDLVRDNGIVIDPADISGFAAAMRLMATDDVFRAGCSEASSRGWEVLDLRKASLAFANAVSKAVPPLYPGLNRC